MCSENEHRSLCSQGIIHLPSPIAASLTIYIRCKLGALRRPHWHFQKYIFNTYTKTILGSYVSTKLNGDRKPHLCAQWFREVLDKSGPVGQWRNQFQEGLPRKTSSLWECVAVWECLLDKRARRKVFWEGYFFLHFASSTSKWKMIVLYSFKSSSKGAKLLFYRIWNSICD